MKTLVLITSLAIAFTSCSRSVFKSQATTTATKDSTYSFVDTSKTITEESSLKITRYGDSLNGSVFIPYSVYDSNEVGSFLTLTEDSLESSGIKIKVGILPTNGGFKVRLHAISKPVETVETTNSTISQANGIAETATKTEAIASTTTVKETKKQSWEAVAVIVLVLLALLLIIFFRIRKI